MMDTAFRINGRDHAEGAGRIGNRPISDIGPDAVLTACMIRFRLSHLLAIA